LFNFVGLQVAETTIQISTPGFTTSTNLGGQPEVATVDVNSDAQRAGVTIGDRVVAVDGKPAAAYLDDQLSRMRAGATVKLTLANRRGQRNIKLKLKSHEEQMYILQDVPSLTAEQRTHRVAWIHGDDEIVGGQ
jgi:predicted metalloprotease with PDZ domain